MMKCMLCELYLNSLSKCFFKNLKVPHPRDNLNPGQTRQLAIPAVQFVGLVADRLILSPCYPLLTNSLTDYSQMLHKERAQIMTEPKRP